MESNPQGKKEFKDLGFGTKTYGETCRLINRDGSFNVVRKGDTLFNNFDLFHELISMSWVKFVCIILFYYLGINILFTSLYLVVGLEHLDGITGETSFGRFLDAFFFSSQTVTTLGYGRISPVGAPASFVAAIESLVGLMGFALITGLLYGRFSRPRARIRYSDNALIAPYEKGRGLMFRIANDRNSQLVEIEVEAALALQDPITKLRKFSKLKLERSKVNFMSLSWTIVHPITPESPFHNLTKEEVDLQEAEIIILLKAFDDAFSQTVYSRTSYRYNEIEWDGKFISTIELTKEGFLSVDLSKISAFEKIS